MPLSILGLLLLPHAGTALAVPADSARADSLRPVRRRPQFNVYPLDYRNTFVRHSNVLSLGGAVGLKYSGKHLFALGYYGLSQAADRNVQTRNNATRTLTDGVKLRYVNLAYTYSFVRARHWEVGLPLEVGLGFSRETILNDLGRELRSFRSNFIPLQAGVTADWKITRWVGLNLAVGYRVIAFKSDLRDNFDGLYYNYGINLYTGNIFDDYHAWRQRRRERRLPHALASP